MTRTTPRATHAAATRAGSSAPALSGTVVCPALLVSAPASGQGKTLVTAALARRHRAAGRRVRVFKCGPDFLDPMILQRASGAPVQQLDPFMGGETHCRALLYAAAEQADLVLVEGAMGLFDGTPSAADTAALFGLPVLAVLDAGSMAQSFGALALGLARYRDDVRVEAVLANRVAGARHADLLRAGLRPDGPRWAGALLRNTGAALPERHLGLVQAAEIADLDARIDRMAAALPEEACALPAPVPFIRPAATDKPSPLLAGRTLAVARDAAFAFLYPANIDLLQAMGATLTFFSPLVDKTLPACDALWLPGGYPELHRHQLAANAPMRAAIRRHYAQGRPILAECGGMLYCADSLTGADEDAADAAPMLGLLPGRGVMQKRLAGLGLQRVVLPPDTGVATAQARDLRGHSFHYSRLETDLPPIATTTTPDGTPKEQVYRRGALTATYMHLYFPSNPAAVAALFGHRGSAAS